MACPNCGCKTTYGYYEDDMDADTDQERCAACGFIFYIDESIDEFDDDYELREAASEIENVHE